MACKHSGHHAAGDAAGPSALVTSPLAPSLQTCQGACAGSSILVLPGTASSPSISPWQVAANTAAVVGLVLALLNLYFARRDRKTDRNRKVMDEFWFQKVVYPESIQPILKYFQDDPLQLLTNTAKPVADRLYAFQNGLKQPAACASMLVGPLTPVRDAIYLILENFEDDVANSLGTEPPQKINELVAETRAAIVLNVQKYHSTL